MSKEVGLIGESRFLHEVINRGLTINQPFGENCAYDFVVDNGEELFRVQVKTTSKKEEKGFKLTVKKGKGSGKKYDENEIDVLVLYLSLLEIFYIIPIKEVDSVGFRVYPEREDLKYSKFKENWKLFERIGYNE